MRLRLSKISVFILPLAMLLLSCKQAAYNGKHNKDECKTVKLLAKKHWAKDKGAAYAYKTDSVFLSAIRNDEVNVPFRDCVIGMDTAVFIKYFGSPSAIGGLYISYTLSGYNDGTVFVLFYDDKGRITKYDMVRPID